MDTTYLRRASLASAMLLMVLCTMTAVSGVSQQHFEWVHSPATFADHLLRDAEWLRAIVVVDDLFIVAYVSATVFLARWLAREELRATHVLIMAGGVLAGLLDLEENHHLLTLTRWAELDLPIPAEQVLRRSGCSQLKWMLGHVAFALVGIEMKGRTLLHRGLRLSLVVVQLPLGAMAWAASGATTQLALTWARYGAFLGGFVLIAWLAKRDDGEALRGARA